MRRFVVIIAAVAAMGLSVGVANADGPPAHSDEWLSCAGLLAAGMPPSEAERCAAVFEREKGR